MVHIPRLSEHFFAQRSEHDNTQKAKEGNTLEIISVYWEETWMREKGNDGDHLFTALCIMNQSVVGKLAFYWYYIMISGGIHHL